MKDTKGNRKGEKKKKGNRFHVAEMGERTHGVRIFCRILYNKRYIICSEQLKNYDDVASCLHHVFSVGIARMIFR